MAELTGAKKMEIAEMWAQLTREQRRSMLHLGRLMILRRLGDQNVEAEIAAIREAAHDGRVLPIATIH